MKASFQLRNTDAVDATLAITMPLGRWKKLLEQLASDYPAWDIKRKIEQMIREAEQQYSMEHTDQE